GRGSGNAAPLRTSSPPVAGATAHDDVTAFPPTASDDRPGVAPADQGGKTIAVRRLGGPIRTGLARPTGLTALPPCGVELRTGLVVVRGPLDLAEDADGRLVEVARVGEPADRERRGR